MPLNDKLLNFGLNNKEAAFYLAALELGKADLTDLANKARLNRTTCYSVIDSLKDKGLVKITIIKRKKYYLASDPEDIQRLIDQKSALLKSLLPQLNGINNLSSKKPRISFYEGESGLINIFLDNLTAKDEILTIAGEKTFNSLVLEKVPNYVEQRTNKKILLKLIAPDSEIMRRWQEQDRKHLRITKLLPKDKLPLKINIDIYNNKIALTSPDEQIGLLIESKDITEALKAIFGVMWSSIS